MNKLSCNNTVLMRGAIRHTRWVGAPQRRRLRVESTKGIKFTCVDIYLGFALICIK